MPTLHALHPDADDHGRMPAHRPSSEVIDLATDGSGPRTCSTTSPAAALLAATALGMVVAGAQNPTHVIERLADGDLEALHEARSKVCLLEVTDDATRQAAARLLESTAVRVSSSPVVLDCGSRGGGDRI